MARSPDFLRLATSATRTLGEMAFDGARDAVIVIDARAKHLPVVLANRAARESLTGRDTAELTQSSLYGCLAPASASLIESLLGPLSDSDPLLTVPWDGGPRTARAPS